MMTNEELEMMTKMNTDSISDLRRLRNEDIVITNKNNDIISKSFGDIAHDMERISGRVSFINTVMGFYIGVKIGNWLYDTFDLGPKIDNVLNKMFGDNNPKEKEIKDESSTDNI